MPGIRKRKERKKRKNKRKCRNNQSQQRSSSIISYLFISFYMQSIVYLFPFYYMFFFLLFFFYISVGWRKRSIWKKNHQKLFPWTSSAVSLGTQYPSRYTFYVPIWKEVERFYERSKALEEKAKLREMFAQAVVVKWSTPARFFRW